MEHEIDKFCLESRWYVFEKSVFFYKNIEVGVHRNTNVLEHRQIKLGAHMFGLFTLLDQCEPNVELSDFVKKESGKSRVSWYDVVNKVHEHNENNNACKFDADGKKVFHTRATCVVTITCRWDNRTHPVEGKYVKLIAIVCAEYGCFNSPRITLITHQILISHPEPNSDYQMNQHHKVKNVN